MLFPSQLGQLPVDFAYSVHTDVGHRTIGAKINGKLVALDTKLSNGDRVEIITLRHNRRTFQGLVKICYYS